MSPSVPIWAVLYPAASRMEATKVAVDVLPLVPVMPIMVNSLEGWAKNSEATHEAARRGFATLI